MHNEDPSVRHSEHHYTSFTIRCNVSSAVHLELPSISMQRSDISNGVPSGSSDDCEREVLEKDEQVGEVKNQDEPDAVVPNVWVRLLQSVRLLPQTTTSVAVEMGATDLRMINSVPLLIKSVTKSRASKYCIVKVNLWWTIKITFTCMNFKGYSFSFSWYMWLTDFKSTV